MEISKVTMSNQQNMGGINTQNQTEKKTADHMKSNDEGIKTMVNESSGKEKSDYSAVSRDGDTLTLSEGSMDDGSSRTKLEVADGKVIAREVKMTDAALAKCSGSKLRALLQQGKISKQQYEKAIKKIAK